MTTQASASLIDNLVPSDGKPTKAARLLGPRADGDFVYVRVMGSGLTTLEAQFYGKDLEKACLYGKQDIAGHDVYYLTNTIERKEFNIRRVAGSQRGGELYEKRKTEFGRQLPKSCKRMPPAPPVDWRAVPDKYPKAKFLMKVAQERSGDLRKVGFTDDQIDTAARYGKLTNLLPLDEQGSRIMDADGNYLEIPFHVHHCVPLQCGGSNKVENFTLVDEMVHLRMFHRGDEPAVSELSEGDLATVAITLPREGQDIISLYLNVTLKTEKIAP